MQDVKQLLIRSVGNLQLGLLMQHHMLTNICQRKHCRSFCLLRLNEREQTGADSLRLTVSRPRYWQHLFSTLCGNFRSSELTFWLRRALTQTVQCFLEADFFRTTGDSLVFAYESSELQVLMPTKQTEYNWEDCANQWFNVSLQEKRAESAEVYYNH